MDEDKELILTDLVNEDLFLEMPLSAQALYFHLLNHADLNCVCNRPKAIMRMTKTTEEDLELLVKNRYVVKHKDGCVIVNIS